MDELDSILEAWAALPDPDAAVLATVVHVEGSAYRRPGARMLILPGGERIGTVSGGCLESDVTRKAWWMTARGQRTLRVYDTGSGEDAVWEFGLGCNGKVHVLLERAGESGAGESLRFLQASRSKGEPGVVVTVLDGDDLGARGYCSGSVGDGLGGVCRHAAVEVERAVLEQRSRLFDCSGTRMFIEFVSPPRRLVIFGAGHDAIPLAGMAQQLGWQVTVADGRNSYATRERFPGVAQVVVVSDRCIPEILPGDAVVMMTHNYPFDLTMLPAVLAARPAYLGLLGPRSRAEQLFGELRIEMPAFVHAPAGLDIGATDPALIAMAILAEANASLCGRSGGMLRHRSGPIHDPVTTAGQIRAWAGELDRPEICGALVA